MFFLILIESTFGQLSSVYNHGRFYTLLQQKLGHWAFSVKSVTFTRSHLRKQIVEPCSVHHEDKCIIFLMSVTFVRGMVLMYYVSESISPLSVLLGKHSLSILLLGKNHSESNQI